MKGIVENLGGFLLLVFVIVAGVVALNDYLSLPIVQKDSATKEVVGVITSDGIEHPASYFFEHGLEKTAYEVEWVRPLSMR